MNEKKPPVENWRPGNTPWAMPDPTDPGSILLRISTQEKGERLVRLCLRAGDHDELLKAVDRAEEEYSRHERDELDDEDE